MKICLIGFQGSGKTTIGRWLALRLDIAFFDLDELVSARHGGRPVQEVFAAAGEEQFRHEETELFMSIAINVPSYVIALGGGAVEAVTRIPEEVRVVYLFRPLSALEAQLSPPYPLWIDHRHPKRSLHQRWEQRHPLYARRACSVVLVEKQSVEDDGRKVLQAIGGLDGQQ